MNGMVQEVRPSMEPARVLPPLLNISPCCRGTRWQVQRVLKPGGVYISISFGTPKLRLPVYGRTKEPWTYLVRKINKFGELSLPRAR